MLYAYLRCETSQWKKLLLSKTLASSEKISTLSYPLTFVQANIQLRAKRHFVFSSLLDNMYLFRVNMSRPPS